MALPKAVQAAADAAERRSKEFAEAQKNAKAKTKGEEASDDTEADDTVQPDDDNSPPENRFDATDRDDGEHQTDGDDDGGEDEQSEPDPALKRLEHKFRVLQGKYNNEVGEVARENSQMRQQIANLQGLLAGLQEARKTDTFNTSGSPDLAGELSQEEIDEYGPELIDLVEKVARRAYEPRIAELQKANERLEKQLGGVSSHVAAKDVYATLDREVEDWRSVNVDDGFKSWLERKDPFSGQQRSRMLAQAFEAGQADRVVAFFKGYLRENAAVTPASGTEQQAQQRRPAPKKNLETLAAPGRGRSGQGGAPKEQMIWTKDSIAAFYADKNAGRIKDPERAKALERDIFKAQQEGRIAQ